MPSDLAQVVLQAARDEKAIHETHRLPEGSGASASSKTQQNGHLQPPFDWRSGQSRQITSSPEPMGPATPQEELGHGQAYGNGLGVSVPAKKRPNTRPKGRPNPSKRLHSSFFGSSEAAAAKQAAKRLYTSESTQDEHDTAPSSHSRNGSGSKPHHIDSEEQDRPAGSSSTSSPMRGPFSRMDSTRGQALLAGSTSGSGSSKTPQRRQSIGQGASRSGSGDDSRRHSVSGLAKRLGAMSETEETDEYESHDDGLQPPSSDRHPSHYFDSRTPLARMNESPENNRSLAPSAPGSGMNTPQRRGSVRSFSNPFGRSVNRQTSGDHQTQAGQAEAQGNEKNQTDGTTGKNKWAALRRRLQQEKKPEELEKYITGQELITDLSSGMMSIMMLKMAFDRDEHDKHRVGQTVCVPFAIC